MFVSVRISPKLAFNGQVAKCEVQALYKEFNIKRTFVGATFEEAFDKFKEHNEYDTLTKIS